jgi:hypothetical protein
MAILARAEGSESKHQDGLTCIRILVGWYGLAKLVIDFRANLLELEAGPSNIKMDEWFGLKEDLADWFIMDHSFLISWPFCSI